MFATYLLANYYFFRFGIANLKLAYAGQFAETNQHMLMADRMHRAAPRASQAGRQRRIFCLGLNANGPGRTICLKAR
jgi:hypothetical protein